MRRRAPLRFPGNGRDRAAGRRDPALFGAMNVLTVGALAQRSRAPGRCSMGPRASVGSSSSTSADGSRSAQLAVALSAADADGRADRVWVQCSPPGRPAAVAVGDPNVRRRPALLGRERLDGTIASAVVVGALNMALILAMRGIALGHAAWETSTRSRSAAGGRPVDTGVLALVFGVVLLAFFGHTSAANSAKWCSNATPAAGRLVRGNGAALSVPTVHRVVLRAHLANVLSLAAPWSSGTGRAGSCRSSAIEPAARRGLAHRSIGSSSSPLRLFSAGVETDAEGAEPPASGPTPRSTSSRVGASWDGPAPRRARSPAALLAGPLPPALPSPLTRGVTSLARASWGAVRAARQQRSSSRSIISRTTRAIGQSRKNAATDHQNLSPFQWLARCPDEQRRDHGQEQEPEQDRHQITQRRSATGRAAHSSSCAAPRQRQTRSLSPRSRRPPR